MSWSCVFCQKEYSAEAVRYPLVAGEICISCAEENIVVYRAGPVGMNKFTAVEVEEVVELLSNADVGETIEVEKRAIPRIKYLKAGEFTGF